MPMTLHGGQDGLQPLEAVREQHADAVAWGRPQRGQGMGQAVDPRLSPTKCDDLLILKPGGTLRPALGGACKEMADVHRILQSCANRAGRWPSPARSPS